MAGSKRDIGFALAVPSPKSVAAKSYVLPLRQLSWKKRVSNTEVFAMLANHERASITSKNSFVFI